MNEGKFIIIDGTDDICIGGFGNDKGNKGLLKYSEEEIARMIMENNNATDNARLVNSLLKTIRNQDNIINKAIEYINWVWNNTNKPTNTIVALRTLENILRGD